MVKAPPIRNDYGSKDCVNLSSPTAVSRIIDDDGIPELTQSYNGKKSEIFGKFYYIIDGEIIQTINYPKNLIEKIDQEAKKYKYKIYVEELKLKYNNKCFIHLKTYSGNTNDLTPIDLNEMVEKIREIAADFLRMKGAINSKVFIALAYAGQALKHGKKLSEYFLPGDCPSISVFTRAMPSSPTDIAY